MIYIELNKMAHQIINSIQNEYPLTKVQTLKIISVLDKDEIVTINSKNSDVFINIHIDSRINNALDYYNYCLSCIVREIFSLIIEPEEMTESKISLEFSKYVKKALVELYAFKYCKRKQIKFIKDEELIRFSNKLLDGLGSFLTNKEIDDIVFRASVESLLNMSYNANSLYNQFYENFENDKIHTKKEMI